MFIGNVENQIEFKRGKDKTKRKSRRKGPVIETASSRKKKALATTGKIAGGIAIGAALYAGVKNRKAIAASAKQGLASGRSRLGDSIDNLATGRLNLGNKKTASLKNITGRMKQQERLQKLATRVRGGRKVTVGKGKKGSASNPFVSTNGYWES